MFRYRLRANYLPHESLAVLRLLCKSRRLYKSVLYYSNYLLSLCQVPSDEGFEGACKKLALSMRSRRRTLPYCIAVETRLRSTGRPIVAVAVAPLFWFPTSRSCAFTYEHLSWHALFQSDNITKRMQSVSYDMLPVSDRREFNAVASESLKLRASHPSLAHAGACCKVVGSKQGLDRHQSLASLQTHCGYLRSASANPALLLSATVVRICLRFLPPPCHSFHLRRRDSAAHFCSPPHHSVKPDILDLQANQERICWPGVHSLQQTSTRRWVLPDRQRYRLMPRKHTFLRRCRPFLHLPASLIP